MRTTILLTLLATAALAAPAYADNAVGFTDPCGDNKAGYDYDGQTQEFPGTGNRESFDIKSFTLSQTASGVRATFEMCAPIAAPSGLTGFRAAGSSISDDCWLTIGAEEGIVPGQDRTARFIKTCREADPGPTGGTPADDGVATHFDITLPAAALTVSGATMTLDVDRAGLTGEAAAALAPGATWPGVGVAAIEGESLAGSGVSSDDEGNSHYWTWAAPFAWDWANTNAALTLS